MKLSINTANIKEINERFPTAAMVKDILSYSINCNLTIKEVIKWKYDQFNKDKVVMKIKEVHEIYAKKKAQDGLLDFDDLLVFWDRLLDEKFVERLVTRKIKNILVDEYQDTNFIQDEIIHKIRELETIILPDDLPNLRKLRELYLKCNEITEKGASDYQKQLKKLNQ